MYYKTVFLYRRQIIIITLLALISAFSSLNKTNAQVSGYVGDRYLASANLTPDLMGWIFDGKHFSMGTEVAFDYVIARESTMGVTAKFDNMKGYYYNITGKNMIYDGPYNKTYDISSNLIELNYKTYSEGRCAPLGSFVKFSLGVIYARHKEFDRESFQDNLKDSQDFDPNSFKVSPSYSSLFLGIGYGETYPITNNLLFNIDAEVRLFTNSNKLLSQVWFGSDGGIKPKDAMEHGVLTRTYFHNTIDASIGLIYTF